MTPSTTPSPCRSRIRCAWTRRRSTTSSTRCGPRSLRRSSRPAGSSRSVRRCSPRPRARRSGSAKGGRIVKEARERQEQLVSQQEVTRQAERAAEDIIKDARAREREIRLGAEDYADEILNTLDVNLSKFIAAVQRGRERLQGRDELAEVG